MTRLPGVERVLCLPAAGWGNDATASRGPDPADRRVHGNAVVLTESRGPWITGEHLREIVGHPPIGPRVRMRYLLRLSGLHRRSAWRGPLAVTPFRDRRRAGLHGRRALSGARPRGDRRSLFRGADTRQEAGEHSLQTDRPQLRRQARSGCRHEFDPSDPWSFTVNLHCDDSGPAGAVARSHGYCVFEQRSHPSSGCLRLRDRVTPTRLLPRAGKVPHRTLDQYHPRGVERVSADGCHLQNPARALFDHTASGFAAFQILRSWP